MYHLSVKPNIQLPEEEQHEHTIQKVFHVLAEKRQFDDNSGKSSLNFTHKVLHFVIMATTYMWHDHIT